jgi:hypothetical protein
MKPWSDWEDWQAGLYWPNFTAEHVTHSERLLGDCDEFLEVAREVTRMWPTAAYHNLRNMWTGRNAWVGQASCLYAHGAPGAATRAAWGALTLDQQRDANKVAELVRIEWEQSNVRQTLFAV